MTDSGDQESYVECDHCEEKFDFIEGAKSHLNHDHKIAWATLENHITRKYGSGDSSSQESGRNSDKQSLQEEWDEENEYDFLREATIDIKYKAGKNGSSIGTVTDRIYELEDVVMTHYSAMKYPKNGVSDEHTDSSKHTLSKVGVEPPKPDAWLMDVNYHGRSSSDKLEGFVSNWKPPLRIESHPDLKAKIEAKDWDWKDPDVAIGFSNERRLFSAETIQETIEQRWKDVDSYKLETKFEEEAKQIVRDQFKQLLIDFGIVEREVSVNGMKLEEVFSGDD